MPKQLQLDSHLYDYLLSVSQREPEILTQLRRETAQQPNANMQISIEQGQLMGLLIQLMGAKQILEIGTFTGYSSLVMALALPETGKIITCDVSEADTAIAQRYWQKAGVNHKIELRLAPALRTLDELLATASANSFDFVFIDADKTNYDAYYEKALQLLRVGGLIAIDNTLWGGNVANPEVQDENTVAIRAFNEKLHQDSRIALSLVPIADGLTLALKNP
jgi:predicted O-methyltransferase YrrM